MIYVSLLIVLLTDFDSNMSVSSIGIPIPHQIHNAVDILTPLTIRVATHGFVHKP